MKNTIFTRVRLLQAALFIGVIVSILSIRLLLLSAHELPAPTTSRSFSTYFRSQPITSHFKQSGKASWYGKDFHKRKTACGQYFNMNGFTAAHRKLPFGTIVCVTDIETGKKVLVCINDRGPFIRSKILDLSWGAADELGGTLETVSAEAYIPEKINAFDEEAQSKQLLAFSKDYKPMLLDIDACTMIDSCTDFTKAIQLQRQLSLKVRDMEITLLVSPNPDFTGSGRSITNKYIYYIGAVLPEIVNTTEISSVDIIK
ncbi:MAG: septal ring lytic transglycosylase RlpA family protein [Bacteroidetes bacterium]|nr:septal ring lytic transglycosylase RlpA family protein [Bacteroidota bacterium]